MPSRSKLNILCQDHPLRERIVRLGGIALSAIFLTLVMEPRCTAVELSPDDATDVDSRLYLDVLWEREKGQVKDGAFYATERSPQGEISPVWSILSVSPLNGKWNILVDSGVAPRVSPNGKILAFQKDEAAFVCRISDPRHVTRLGDHNWGPICWSPKSNEVILGVRQAADKGQWKLANMLVSISDKASSTIAPNSNFDIEDWAEPEPAWVAVTGSSMTGGHQLALIARDGMKVDLITHKGVSVHPRFSPDGESIAFIRQKAGSISARIYSRRSKAIKEIYRSSSEAIPDRICWSPDGQQVAILVLMIPKQLRGQVGQGLPLGKRHRKIVVLDVATKASREVAFDGANIIDIGSIDWR